MAGNWELSSSARRICNVIFRKREYKRLQRKEMNFQVEVISESLRELQQEKRRLENFLQNERARRKDTEAKLNLVNARFSNVQERHSKISATRDIAKQRMKESEELVNKLQKLQFEKQKIISDTKERINLQKKRKEEMSTHFAQQLDNLAKMFFNAREEFNETKLLKEREELERKISETKHAVLESQQVVEDLADQFSKCKVDEEEKRDMKEDWPSVEEVEITLNMFREEEEFAKEQYNKMAETVKLANERLDSMKENLKSLETSRKGQAEE